MFSNFKSLNEIFYNNSINFGDKKLVYFRDDENKEKAYSYKDIMYYSMDLSKKLINYNLKTGDKVIISLDTGVNFIISFFGVLFSGAIPIPIPPVNSSKKDTINRMKHILLDSNAKYVIVHKKIEDKCYKQMQGMIEKLNMQRIIVNLYYTRLGLDKNIEYYTLKSEDVCFIQYTSGSSGLPKGVPIKQKNLFHNVDTISRAIDIKEKDFAVSWLPLYHDMGLAFIKSLR
ncbi:AMP-binding protein [Herbivorax sp. ANBcel31]|uniref:AMP-binding protein n=1 Tax=Herbivorax sp. ANBcel31 TaxID=3069754 RepID=UPI0027B44BEB|nr:AMP-binding protein [Herbivorax sp. ANBcel31]MDQ2087767.1 AMP-binding protein [Herbivorax sp. ANBcel31]